MQIDIPCQSEMLVFAPAVMGCPRTLCWLVGSFIYLLKASLNSPATLVKLPGLSIGAFSLSLQISTCTRTMKLQGKSITTGGLFILEKEKKRDGNPVSIETLLPHGLM